MTRRFDGVDGGARAADGQRQPVARSQHHRGARRGARMRSSLQTARCVHAKFVGRCCRRSPPSQLYPYSTVNDGMLEVVPGEATGAVLS